MGPCERLGRVAGGDAADVELFLADAIGERKHAAAGGAAGAKPNEHAGLNLGDGHLGERIARACE